MLQSTLSVFARSILEENVSDLLVDIMEEYLLFVSQLITSRIIVF